MELKKQMKTNQPGYILVFSLIILLVITVASLTTMKTGILGKKTSVNSQDQMLATQSAASAIAAAKKWLATQCFKPTACDTLPSDGTCKVYNLNKAPVATLSAQSTDSPQYVIEESIWDPAEGNQYYTITAVGVGKSTTNTATLTATYVKHTPFITADGKPPGNLCRLRSVANNAYRIPAPNTTAINASLNIDPTITGVATKQNESSVLKTIFQIQAQNGNFVRAKAGPNAAPDFTLVADISGPPASSDTAYQFKIEITDGKAAAGVAATPALWNMCVLDNGTVTLSEYQATSGYFTKTQRYFMELDNSTYNIIANKTTSSTSPVPDTAYFKFLFLNTDSDPTVSQATP